MSQQKKILDQLGVIQHHDAITGTGVKRVAEDYFRKVLQAQNDLNDMNRYVMSSYLKDQYGITINRLDSSVSIREVNDKIFSPYHMAKEFLIIAVNPSQQSHSQLV